MKIIFVMFVSILLSACAATQKDQQTLFDSKVFKSTDGHKWTVNNLKSDYLKKTGSRLIVSDTTSCGWDENCYYNKWASAHDEGINKYLSSKKNDYDMQLAKCLSEPECKRKNSLSKENSNLANLYSMVMATHPYYQSDYDLAIRTVCEKATASQKSGISRKDLEMKVQDVPGIGPQDRVQIVNIAVTCWNISSLNGNWKEALRG